MNRLIKLLRRLRRKHLPTTGEQIHDMRAEYERLFPDRCFVCSYYRFGRDHGMWNHPTPYHVCKEEPHRPFTTLPESPVITDQAVS